jgi:type II secretory pathway pseudopilin PulG
MWQTFVAKVIGIVLSAFLEKIVAWVNEKKLEEAQTQAVVLQTQLEEMKKTDIVEDNIKKKQDEIEKVNSTIQTTQAKVEALNAFNKVSKGIKKCPKCGAIL